MFLGFVRDRGALVFTILIPVIFLVLLGSIYKSSGTPQVSVVEVGNVSLLDGAGHGQLSKILQVTRSRNLGAALNDVRQGNADAVVQQQGTVLVVHYSIADQVTAGVVQAVFASIVQQADQQAGRPARRLPAGHPPDRGPVTEADPVPRARPARLGHR